MDIKFKKRVLISSLATLTLLSACGGGDSSESTPVTPPPPSPSVTFDSQTVIERSNVTLSAKTVSISDIASYQWQVTSDHQIELTNADTSTVSFSSPSIREDESIQLSLTIKDQNDTTYSATGTVTVEAIKHHLTLSGKVLDYPFDDVSVEALVNNTTSAGTVSVDNQGGYQLNLSVDEDDVDLNVTLVTHSDANDNKLSYASNLGLYSSFSENADSGLTSNIFEPLVISPLTTAIYSTATVENAGLSPNTLLEEQTLAFQTDFDLIMSLAEGIANLATKYEEYEPDLYSEAFPNFLSLLKDARQQKEVFHLGEQASGETDFKQHFYNTYSYFSSETYEFGNELHALPRGNESGKDSFIFNADGTGSFDENAITWIQEDNVRTVTFNEPLYLYRTEDYGKQYRTGYTLKKVKTLGNISLFKMTSLFKIEHFDENDNMTGESTESYVSSFYGASNDIKLSFEVRKGDKYFLPIPSKTYENVPEFDSIWLANDTLVFDEGTVDFESLGITGIWTLSDNELIIDIPTPKYDMKRIIYSRLEDTLKGSFYSIKVFRDTTDQVALSAGRGDKLKNVAAFNIDELPGVYLFNNNNLEYGSSYYWTEIHANGNVERFVYNLQSNKKTTIHIGKWDLVDNRTLRFKFYKDDLIERNNDCREQSYTNGCFLVAQRFWKLARSEKNEMRIMLKHHSSPSSNFHFSASYKKIESRPIEIDPGSINIEWPLTN